MPSIGELGQLPPSLTDLGNAELFVGLYRDRFRHVEGNGWYVWQDYRWRRGRFQVQ